MDKYCDTHPTCKLVCPACNGKLGGKVKGSVSLRKRVACKINASQPRKKKAISKK